MEHNKIKQVITDGDTIEYHLGETRHNPSGPAMIWPNGVTFWFLFDVRHRYYGPAGSFSHWYIRGEQVD